MREIENLGYRTECMIHQLSGQIEEKKDYYVIRTPSNPTYHWGNLLLYKTAPASGDFNSWLTAFDLEFGPDFNHVTFGWDSSELGDIEAFKENRFSIANHRVLELGKLNVPRPTSAEIDIRTIESDSDWKAVVELQLLVFGEGDNPAYLEFLERKFQSFRELSEGGNGDWWGAFNGAKLVGDLGLYFNADRSLARFQDVETHPDFRRRAICSNLLYKAIDHLLEKGGNPNIVICAETGNPSYEVYRSLGFENSGSLFGASLPCPYTKRFE